MKYPTRISPVLVLLSVVLVLQQLAGCASATKSTAMVAESDAMQHRHPYSVQVQVSGGHETGTMDNSQISNEAFTEALVESIEKTGVFAETRQAGNADYLLHVTLLDLEQPIFGASMKVRMEAAWMLINNASGETVWKQAIESQYTAGAFDAFAAVTRIRLATEGAARNNIQQGIALLSGLDL